MTLEELIEQMHALEEALERRVEIRRTIITIDGTVIKQIYVGSFFRQENK